METRKLLTVRETADMLRVRPLCVYQIIRAGRLRAVRLMGAGDKPKCIRIRIEDVEAYLDTARYVDNLNDEGA
jgi:excisionase family DNA binding protein